LLRCPALRSRLDRTTLEAFAARQRRRAEMLGEAAVGGVSLARWRLSGRRSAPDPRGSLLWVPAHSVLGRRGLLGSTALEERAFCQWYARVGYRGAGAIVDLGTWLGSTTLPLAKGMSQRPSGAPTTRIHTYDRFIWEEWMSEFAGWAHTSRDYRPGDNFRAEVETVLGRYRGLVDIHEVDLVTEQWTGGPIELLVVDAMKSWELARNQLDQFLAAVAPGGVVYHQDFSQHWTSWIHLFMYRLRDRFALYYDPPHADGVAFRVIRPLAGIDAAELTSPKAYQPDEVTAAFDYSRSLVRPEKHANITAAEGMFYVHTGDLERAAAIFRQARERGLTGDIHAAEEHLRNAQASLVGG
jgi:hypothetical protein